MTTTTTAATPGANDPAAPPVAASTPPAPAAPPATGAEYTAKTATEVMELCAIAGVSLKDATAMVKAETPLEKVRADLAARAADDADAAHLDTSRTPPKSGSSWDEVTAKVNETYGVSRK